MSGKSRCPRSKQPPSLQQVREKVLQHMIRTFSPEIDGDVVRMVIEDCDWDYAKCYSALNGMIDANNGDDNSTKDYDVHAMDERQIQEQYDELQRIEKLNEEKKRNSPTESSSGSTVVVQKNSLCGLKVEYRPRGTPASLHSSDDDADVVIEEESSASCYRLPQQPWGGNAESRPKLFEAAEAGAEPAVPEAARSAYTGAIPKRKIANLPQPEFVAAPSMHVSPPDSTPRYPLIKAPEKRIDDDSILRWHIATSAPVRQLPREPPATELEINRNPPALQTKPPMPTLILPRESAADPPALQKVDPIPPVPKRRPMIIPDHVLHPQNYVPVTVQIDSACSPTLKAQIDAMKKQIDEEMNKVAAEKKAAEEKLAEEERRKVEESMTPEQRHLESLINKGYRVLVFMRGCPGSGKSHLAHQIVERTVGGAPEQFIYSTDDYFKKINNGVYRFDLALLSTAHSYNKNRVRIAIKKGVAPIIIDNTNLRSWEMEEYLPAAITAGYIIITAEPSTYWKYDVKELFRRNHHDVPLQKIVEMLHRFERHIDGATLLRNAKQSYSRSMRPPQMRCYPPLPGQTIAPQQESVSEPPKPTEEPKPELPERQPRTKIIYVRKPEKLESIEYVNAVVAEAHRIHNEDLKKEEEEKIAKENVVTRPVKETENHENSMVETANLKSITLDNTDSTMIDIIKPLWPKLTVGNKTLVEPGMAEFCRFLVSDMTKFIPKKKMPENNRLPFRSYELKQQESLQTTSNAACPSPSIDLTAEKNDEEKTNDEPITENKLELCVVQSEEIRDTVPISSHNLPVCEVITPLGVNIDNKATSNRTKQMTEIRFEEFVHTPIITTIRPAPISIDFKFNEVPISTNHHSQSDVEKEFNIASENYNVERDQSPKPSKPSTPEVFDHLKLDDWEEDEEELVPFDWRMIKPTSTIDNQCSSLPESYNPLSHDDYNPLSHDDYNPLSHDDYVFSRIAPPRQSFVDENIDMAITQNKVDDSQVCPDLGSTVNENIDMALTQNKVDDSQVCPDLGSAVDEDARDNGTVYMSLDSFCSGRLSPEIDLTQYDLCGVPKKDKEFHQKQVKKWEVEEEDDDDDDEDDDEEEEAPTSSRGLAGIFNYLKKSILGDNAEENEHALSGQYGSEFRAYEAEAEREAFAALSFEDDGDFVRCNVQQLEEVECSIRNADDQASEEVECSIRNADDQASEEVECSIRNADDQASENIMANEDLVNKVAMEILAHCDPMPLEYDPELPEYSKTLEVSSLQSDNYDCNMPNFSLSERVDVRHSPEHHNMALIDWREISKPINFHPAFNPNTQQPVPRIFEMRDQATNTLTHDFYLGNNDKDEPLYRRLDARNRSINEPNNKVDVDPPPPTYKLLLDKGTMTANTSVFGESELFDLERENTDAEDRGEELAERFAYLPRSCIQDVYENLCQRNFDWTVDFLCGLQQEQIDLYANDEDSAGLAPVQDKKGQKHRTSSESSSSCSRPGSPSYSHSQAQSSPIDARQPKRRSRGKRNQDRLTGEQLALKQHLEGQFVLNQESYPEHTLKVKKWKNKADNKKVTEEEVFPEEITVDVDVYETMEQETQQLTEQLIQPLTQQLIEPLTQQLTELQYEPQAKLCDYSDSDDSTQSDDVSEEGTMELVLGHEFVNVLESEFGDAGSDGLFPVVQVPRSLAQQLHKLWNDSVQQQLQALQTQIDAMIQQDAEYALQLAAEEAENIKSNKPTTFSNVKQIIEMEVALATCQIDNKFSKTESQEERQLRITRMTLHEMFSHYDEDALYNILEASNRDLDETIKIIMENSQEQPSLTMADVLKKEKNFCISLENDSTRKTLRHHHTVDRNSDESSGDEASDSQAQMSVEELMNYATNCRHKASQHLKLRFDNLTKAHMAARAKMGDLARIYVDRAETHRNERTLLNERAASALLAAQVHRNKDDTIIDLHHLHVVEALTSLDVFIEGHLASMTRGQRKVLYIVTGRGRHSPGQRSKIKPAVAKRLNAMNIRFQEEETNAGMLNVYLRKK